MKGLLVSAALCLAAVSVGQVAPQNVYNGVGRVFWVRVMRPKGASGPMTLRLLTPVTAQVLATAIVKPGAVDLSKAFPALWKQKDTRVLYLQLAVNAKPLGPAVVFQPMTIPPLSRLKADGKTAEFVAQDQCYAGIRAWVDQDVIFDTSSGAMRFRLRPDCAPNTVYNVMEFVKGGLYKDTIWHRVVKFSHGYPFVIQGGDPAGTGDGGPGFSYTLEDSPLPHDFGVISIARDADPNTNGCQVFVCLSREGTARLDHKYPSFGECISGADTILKIASVPTGKADRPLHPPVIYNANLVDAAPYGTGPKPVKRPAEPVSR